MFNKLRLEFVISESNFTCFRWDDVDSSSAIHLNDVVFELVDYV